MSNLIIYKHENGYSASLYGKSSMSIFLDGKEVLHTGFRSVNTKEEVMKVLEGMPMLRDAIKKIVEEGNEANT